MLFTSVTEENNGKYRCRAITSEGPLETSAYLSVEATKRKRKDLHPKIALSKSNNKMLAVDNNLIKDNEKILNNTLSSTILERRHNRHLKRQQLRRMRIARRQKQHKKSQEKIANKKTFEVPQEHKHQDNHKKETYLRYDVKDPDHHPNSVFGSWFAS